MEIQFIGHSTFLIKTDDQERYLFDPWFSDTAFKFIPRTEKPAISPKDVPKLDGILITHLHPDHFDQEALKTFNFDSRVMVPTEKAQKKVEDLGFEDTTVAEKWNETKICNLTITLLPANCSIPQSTYLLEDGKTALYFGGDTKYFNDFEKIGKQYAIDVALLPIDGVKFKFMSEAVMNPEKAADAAEALDADYVVPMHYGTSYDRFLLQVFKDFEPGRPKYFINELKKRGNSLEPKTLDVGETWEIPNG